MRYLKRIITLLVLVWGGLIIAGSRATPGSIFYLAHTQFNQPVWVWLHITSQGRTAALLDILDTRYTELEHSWIGERDTETKAARKALVNHISWLTQVIGDQAKASNYKDADTLASLAASMTRAHIGVLHTLIIEHATTRFDTDLATIKQDYTGLLRVREEVVDRFRSVQRRDNFVSGIDDKLRVTKELLNTANAGVTYVSNLLQPTQEGHLELLLKQADAQYTKAQDKLAIDQYIDAYTLANDAQGTAWEAIILARSTKDFGVPAVPAVLE